MIKAIVFDLSEVLLTGIKETSLALAAKHKIDRFTDPRAVSFSVFDNPHPLLVPLVEEFFIGKATEDEYLEAVLQVYPELRLEDDLKQHLRDNFIEIEGTREIVLKLKGLGYKLGLLSVHAREWIDYCEKKFDFHQMFDALAYSFEDGVSKPHPQAYEFIIKKLGVEAGECLFIDDSPINVEAAQAVGMKAVVFTSAEELHTILTEILENYKD